VRSWITEIGRRLERDTFSTIDYGHRAAELFGRPSHARHGCSRIRDHRANGELLCLAGQQRPDRARRISQLSKSGANDPGWKLPGSHRRRRFCWRSGSATNSRDLHDDGETETDRVRPRLQLKTLIHPEGMGERFQVLIQQKGVSGARLSGLSGIGPRI